MCLRASKVPACKYHGKQSKLKQEQPWANSMKKTACTSCSQIWKNSTCCDCREAMQRQHK